jgi:hypothetical protein
VGHLINGEIINCAYTGNITTTSGGPDHVGGIAGAVETSATNRISGCYTTGDITVTASGYLFVGGIVGNLYAGTIDNCYSTGDVSGNNSSGYAGVGGIAGKNTGTNITDCYAKGAITSNASPPYAGGIVGENSGSISGCVAFNSSIGTGTITGRIWGSGSGSGSNNYGLDGMTVDGSPFSGGNDNDKNGADAATIDQNLFDVTAGWDFTDIWEWSVDRPKLRNNPE